MANQRLRKRTFGIVPKLVLAAAALLFPARIFSQNTGPSGRGVVMPPATVPLGQQDPAALQAIRAYQQAVGAGTWVGIQAEGSFTPNAPDTSGNPMGPEQMTLWILRHRGFRLDIQTAAGVRSMRTDGGYGAIRHRDGHIRLVDARNAFAGLFAFPALMEAGFPRINVTLIDDGIVAVDGAELHRITMGKPWPGTLAGSGSEPQMSITDLYFDPHTNLLQLSATATVNSRSDPTQYLRVIQYGDYQTTTGVGLPEHFAEYLNGQLLWTLQLSSVQLQPGLDDSGFRF